MRHNHQFSVEEECRPDSNMPIEAENQASSWGSVLWLLTAIGMVVAAMDSIHRRQRRLPTEDAGISPHRFANPSFCRTVNIRAKYLVKFIRLFLNLNSG